MKINSVLLDSKVLSVDSKSNQDGSINWKEIVLQTGNDINTITASNEVANAVKNGSKYNFVLQITEVPKATRNGGAYMANKFKLVGLME